MTAPAPWAPADCDAALDALGLRCPLPVIRLEAALRGMATGQRLAVRCDDPIAAVDIPHHAASGGHACERVGEAPPCVFVVTRGREARRPEARGV